MERKQIIIVSVICLALLFVIGYFLKETLYGQVTYVIVEGCTDGIQNGNEEGIDCGGSCPTPCPPPPNPGPGGPGGSGGGGGGGGYNPPGPNPPGPGANPPGAPCVSSWQCGNWTVCQLNPLSNTFVQTRTCTDLNGCPNATSIPPLIQLCTPGSNSSTGSGGNNSNGSGGGPQPSPPTSSSSLFSWILPLVVGLVLVGGGITTGVIYHRRNRFSSTKSKTDLRRSLSSAQQSFGQQPRQQSAPSTQPNLRSQPAPFAQPLMRQPAGQPVQYPKYTPQTSKQPKQQSSADQDKDRASAKHEDTLDALKSLARGAAEEKLDPSIISGIKWAAGHLQRGVSAEFVRQKLLERKWPAKLVDDVIRRARK